MAMPEGHVDRVCLRDNTMCPYLVSIIDAVKRTKRYACVKGQEDGTRLFERVFADDPELVQAITDGRPAGNCSGTPAYVEYSES